MSHQGSFIQISPLSSKETRCVCGLNLIAIQHPLTNLLVPGHEDFLRGAWCHRFLASAKLESGS